MHSIRGKSTMRGRQRGTNTRREALRTGTLGLAGVCLAGFLKGRADAQQTTAQHGGSGEPPGGCTLLEPGEPAEVGMSAERLGEITARLQAETGTGGITSASILVARRGKVVLHRGFGKLNPHPMHRPLSPTRSTCWLPSRSRSVCAG